MPSPTTTNLPRPKSWDEFEDICADLLKRIWKDPYIVRNGRSGQKQHGVDIFGYPEHLGSYNSGKISGAQCKDTEVLLINTVEAEVEKAAEFEPSLAEYVILTTAKRDSVVQHTVRTRQWPFRIHLAFWEDISLELSGYDDLLQKHFPGWLKKTTSRDDVLSLVYSAEPKDFYYDDSIGVYVYIRDVSLRLVQDRTSWFDPDGRDKERFYEDWVSKYPDPHAYKMIVHIEYGGTRVETTYNVSVDGGRYIIPYPKSATELVISKSEYALGRILNLFKGGLGGFDYGLKRAGITVEQE